MDYPDFIKAMPSLELPFPDDVVQSHVVRSDDGLVVFFRFLKDVHLPPHSHLGQWGTVIAGQITLSMNGETRVCGPGDAYDIPAGTEHEVKVEAGTIAVDVFEEPDRYPIRR